MFIHSTNCTRREIEQVIKRNISIHSVNTLLYKKAAVPSSSETVSTNVSQWKPVKDDDIAIQLNKDEPSLQVLGEAQSTLSLTLPPSVPAYIRRGSLISVFASSRCKDIKSSVTSSLRVLQPFKRLFVRNLTPSYQRLQSLVPLNVLVSAYSVGNVWEMMKSTIISPSSQTFCNIFMDGSVDWALFDSSALHVHVGNSLFISSQVLPKLMTTGEPTGFSKFFKQGYTSVSGRGWISLVGEGSIFKFELDEEEEVLVKRENLLASTIKDPGDFKTGSFSLTDINHKSISQQKLDNATKESERLKIKALITKTEGHTPNYWDKSKAAFLRLKFSLEKFFKKSSMTFGNGDYIKVTGPRLLLINSGTGHDKFQYGNSFGRHTSSDAFKQLHHFMQKNGTPSQILTEGDSNSTGVKRDGAVNHNNINNFKDRECYQG